MNDFGIINATIESTFLGMQDHGPTLWVNVDHEHGHQGFGGYGLRDYGERLILRILEVLEVDSWEKLPGMNCRVRGGSGGLTAIGHIVKNQWFCPKDEYESGKRQ